MSMFSRNPIAAVTLTVTFIAALAFTGTSRADVVLVDEQAAQAVIVVPNEPTEVAAYAAQELADHVRRATGVTLAIVEESALGDGNDTAHRVYVGATAAARQLGIDPAALPAEVAVVRSEGDALYIVGRDEPGDPLDTAHIWAGTLWGVYEVLERDLGVRWLWPGELGVHVPRAERVVLDAWDERIVPHLERRRLRPFNRDNDPRYGFTAKGQPRYVEAERVFLRRHRMGQSQEPTPLRAGHSYGSWWEQYGEAHPEWFQLWPDGHRGPRGDAGHRVAMCVSNTGFHDELVRRFKASRQANPQQPPILSIGENDVHDTCACDACTAWDDPQPTAAELAAMPRYARSMYHPHNAARYARFWKTMHQRLREIEPDAIVTSFIYTSYFVPPQQEMELHPNIVLGFVPYARRGPELPNQRSFWFPRHQDEQRWVMQQWDRWQQTGARLYYRPNYTLDGYAMPHVYTHQLAEVFQHYLTHGASGTDFDSLVGQWSAQGTTMYLLARLHTRPEADVEALLDEYYGAFGPAAAHVRDYFDYWEQHTMGLLEREDEILARYGTRRLHTYPRFAHEFFPPESFTPAAAILDRAAAAAERDGDELHAQRVAYLRQGLTHARLCVQAATLFADESATAEQRRAALDELAAFRHEAEDQFIANYHWITRQERNAWSDEAGFFESR